MAAFNREMIPNRQPHAKGGGAFGHFEVTADMSAYTRAAFLQPGARTDVVVRFSTNAGEEGSADTVRDPRGFAIKFYTDEGNFDMVGISAPIFFMRDPMKFQHFIHAEKRRADNGLFDHEAPWDFFTLLPESAHMVAWVMGDRGMPLTWRHMDGFSSHTYMWVNAAGERFWVKYHFKTDQGIEFMSSAEGVRIAGIDADNHRRDLYDAIKRGEFPSWTLKMQIMPYEAAKDYHINPFDLTKTWPYADYPLIEVGKLVLDRNPTDFFSQIEQVAFEPSNLVPGTGLSPDRMLLGRAFSYGDAHRARLGVNYKQIPVNAPTCPVRSYVKGGAMRMRNVSDPVYAPNSKGGPAPDGERYPENAVWAADGDLMRSAYTLRKDDDDFGQANALVTKVMDDAARDRLVSNVVGLLLHGVQDPVLSRVFDYWSNIDPGIGQRIKSGVLHGKPDK
jgi:catalase